MEQVPEFFCFVVKPRALGLAVLHAFSGARFNNTCLLCMPSGENAVFVGQAAVRGTQRPTVCQRHEFGGSLQPYPTVQRSRKPEYIFRFDRWLSFLASVRDVVISAVTLGCRPYLPIW